MNNRIFLLNPPTKGPTTSFPLGLAYLSAVLRKNGYEVMVVDAAAPYNSRSNAQIVNAIKEFKPIFVGVTLKYDFISEKYALIRELKELGFPVIAGGSHVNILPREVIEHGADIVSIGEGEDAVLEIAQALKSGRGLDGIRGLGMRKENGDIVFTRQRDPIHDLDRIPFPDYSDFKVDDYISSGDHALDKTYFDVFTARGCPHRCTYCSASRVWKGSQRRRSARNVFDEIVYLMESFGARHVAFMDNEPLVDKDRIYELCDLLEKNNVKINISSRARIDNIDEKLLRRMMQVGFYKIAIGVESGDDETLKKVNRFYTQKDILSAMEALDRVGFPIIHFNNLIGFPWETRKHFNSTLNLNVNIPKTLTYFVNVITPYPMPGTPLYEDYYKEYGFKDWWLDSGKYEKVDGTDKDRPFYMVFMPMLRLVYFKIDFWNYSKAVKKDILNMQLELQRIAYVKNGRFSAFELAVVFFFIRLSIKLYLASPFLEKLFLMPFYNRFVLGYAKRYVFKEQ